MHLDQIDAEIGRLRRAADTVSANLLELERDPNRELIDAAGLQGVSAERWATATNDLGAIWQWHRRFAGFLEELGKRRGTKARLAPDQEAALEAFITGPSIEISRDDVPLAQRALLGSATETTLCTADELLQRMSDCFDEVNQTLAAISNAWDTMVTRVSTLRVMLTGAHESGIANHDPAARATLDALQGRVDLLAEVLVLDPLAVSPDDLDSIEAGVATLQSEIDAARQLRAGFDDRMAKARALLDEVRSAVEAAHAAHAEVTAKIANASVPDPPSMSTVPVDDLDAVESLAIQGRWRDAEIALASWSATADEVLRDAFACASANRAPIEWRNQMRGLLDGYHAMARRLGVIEDVRVSALHVAARDALFTAPTDLPAAQELVRAYRDALPREPVEREATR
ncbi:MAG: hypothetical protein ABW033_00485 [Acidimicrobiia bacterium]